MKGESGKVLNRFRKMNTYILVFAILFLLQKYTIGLFPGFKNLIILDVFSLQDLVFVVSSLLFILLFVRADIPKKGGLQ